MSSKLFQRHGASSSSIEADYLRLSVDSVHDLADRVTKGLQLNERQCQDLSSKLVLTVQKIQKLVPPSGPLNVPFGSPLKNLYRVLEKAKLLVRQCSATDWCRAAVFQIHNEGAFRELLLEVGLCYNVLYEVTKVIIRDWVWTRNQALDLRQSSLFLPAPETDVREDQETLKRRLQQVAGTADVRNSYLASYLLKKLDCISAADTNENFNVPDALLWMNETQPEGTWKWLSVIGSGSGAACVCRYDWLGIPCARKEFHCRVDDDTFVKEAAILAQLDHPNIIKFFCCSNDPEKGECFIAMEHMEMSLAGLIESRAKARRSFPILHVLDIMTQIARGVCYLHGLNIAHRDLKPLNVVSTETRVAHLEDCFCVKLVDFGMSKTKVQVSKSNTISIPGVGTTKYRAPEVFPQAQRGARGLKRKVNWFKADAYSFGITCAVLLSLETPFEDVPASKLYEELLQGVRPELPGSCPEALVALLEDCWATEPQTRPRFTEICSRLEPCLEQEFLRVSCEGLQGSAGSEYIETVSMKKSDELSLCQCANNASFNSDAAKEAIGKSQFDEEASSPSGYYPEDRPNIILSELGRKKKVGFWSYTMSTFVPFKKFRENRSIQLKFQQKCKKFDVRPTLFPYDELRAATRDFHKDMKLGESVFGAVYKGVLPNGRVVVVKKSSLGRFRASLDVLSNEVVLLAGMKHKNLVIPEGCCLHDHQWLVVYEYVENFNVSQILLDKGPSRQMVAWPVRLKILLGVAQGLHYLHALAHARSIHRNIAARNVFLDRKLDPKIGGFCLVVSDEKSYLDHVAGTKGYIAPECSDGYVSDKADVFSFGVLGLEIISGRHNWEMMNEVYLREWAWQLFKENRRLELVDPALQLTDVEVRDVQQVIKVCLMCVEDTTRHRPSMDHIVSILQGDTELDGRVLGSKNVVVK